MLQMIITRPDDWHVHLRDGDALKHTVVATARDFERALIMPNLKPALMTLSSLLTYREQILSNLPKTSSFNPLLTFYLNEQVTPDDLISSKAYPFIMGAKLYPAGATTNSEQGARSLKNLYPLLDIMQQQDLVLQIHGEVTHGDIFDRESVFITEQLQPIISNFPKLRIVLEHISTQAAVDFIKSTSDYVAATITPHHLLYNRNQLLAGGIKPHYYCLPILKHEKDQHALQQAAVSGNPKFFAGTDSAPHSQQTKENACGCAGIYSAPYALALYTQLFDELNQLNRLNHFMSHFGANFYHMPVNQKEITLIKQMQHVPELLPLGNEYVVPIAAGSSLPWSVLHEE
ncbi:dihydroorotase, homodimeric type [Legionella beliardensis]|uniref:Dihydroorotase n=1 Tax=Legionella beliardensis TaxID=91822 RepID=A0A378HZ87_9GAMM|nr:dihydroorotase [Legionella beliardensis]STX27616.1 dihydroorotase, homodimeric type [Legionella beliardensis]